MSYYTISYFFTDGDSNSIRFQTIFQNTIQDIFPEKQVITDAQYQYD